MSSVCLSVHIVALRAGVVD